MIKIKLTKSIYGKGITQKNLKILNKLLYFKDSNTLLIVLLKVYGLSYSSIFLIFIKLGLNPNLKFEKMSTSQLNLIINFFDRYFLDEGLIKNIENLCLLRFNKFLNYKNFRFRHGLPVNGQRTHSNAKTCRSVFFHKKLLTIIKDFEESLI